MWDDGRGPGRSIPAFDLPAGLTAVRHHLSRYGGHRAAAGLTMPSAWIEAFAGELAEHAATKLGADDLRPQHRVDAVVGAPELSLELADELARLEPFGLGNPAPTLLAPAARLHAVERIGDGRHLR